jgi:type I restriction enzyme S subunit
MSFPRYERYKDSGVEWLGEVPEHWQVTRLKNTTSECRNGVWGADANGDEWDIACVRVADFDRNRLCVSEPVQTLRNVTASERDGRLLRRGNLLLEKSGGGDLQPVGCVVLYDSEQQAVCSNFVARIEIAVGFDSSYCRYLHAAIYALRLSTRSINQTSGIQNLDQSAYLNEVAALPPEHEQTAVANFLDRETAKIDALIDEQRRLIDLLKEKRQAVISHAVTKGIDPAVPMKHSKVESIGLVPSHWSVGPLKRFAKVIDCKHVTVDFVESGKPIVSIRELKNDCIEIGEAKLASDEDWDFLRENRIPVPGDLIICRNASVGAVGEVTLGMEICMGQDVCLVRPSAPSGFNLYMLISTSVRKQIDALLVGATIRRLNVEAIRNLVVTYPPTGESFVIAKYLRLENLKFTSLIQEAAHATNILQERRSALISAAVTGKIDVRSYTAKEAA